MFLRAVIALLALAFAAGGAQAQNQPFGAPKSLPLAAFFGVFKGSGIAESEDNPQFRTSMRETQVEIRPADAGGFSIAWSTTAPRGNPNQPTQKTKTTEAVFKPSTKPGVFEAVKPGNPVAGGDLMWARLQRQTLTVYAMTTTEDGRYEMQKWDRTLQGTGMLMTYSRVSDGQPTRTVKARLTKEGR
jgi:hypothetical protein